MNLHYVVCYASGWPLAMYSLLSESLMYEKKCDAKHEANAPHRYVRDTQKWVLPSKPGSVRQNYSFSALKVRYWIVVLDNCPVFAPAKVFTTKARMVF